ncbi:unnamed protein product [Linum tenue]|uniref:Uncharacterized protein n=1 Tax=Linum tenue TaxID=586396 RepID=A0AAV0IRP6_9ROSI|nr:unnamed protein product [Linum tenue]
MGMGSNSKRSSGLVLRSLSPRGRSSRTTLPVISHLPRPHRRSCLPRARAFTLRRRPSSAPRSTTQIRLSDARQSIFPESFVVADVPILDRQIHISQSQHIRRDEAHQSHLQPPREEDVYVLSDLASWIVPLQSPQEQSPERPRRRELVHAEQAEHEEIRDGEFAGEDRLRGRRLGEESVAGFDSTVVARRVQNRIPRLCKARGV